MGDSGVDETIDAEIVQLDNSEVESFGSDMATCLRDATGLDISDDFLLADDLVDLDLDEATPEQEQALIRCMNGSPGIDEVESEAVQADP